MNRREFLALGAAGASMAALDGCTTCGAGGEGGGAAASLEVLPPAMPNLQLRAAKTAGKVAC